jgi:Zn-dependent peptidase ImmA (M78 family)
VYLDQYSIHFQEVKFSKMAISVRMYDIFTMTETEYKEKVKIDDDQAKVERESKDKYGNKVKEKHEVKQD